MEQQAKTNTRVANLVEELEELILEFMRERRVTHDEYRIATDLIIASVKAGEESLLFDVFFEAQATDNANIGREGSPEAIEGPFYFPGAPDLPQPYVMPQRPDELGEVLFFKGRVTAPDGSPLAGAQLDLWHADAQGLYSKIHPGIPEWNLRGRFRADAEGHYEVRTIVPPPYEIPKAGPTGQVLNALGRHFYRPAHLHVNVGCPGYRGITSQLYFEGGEYLDSDVANAVRDGLVTKLEHRDGSADIAARGLDRPYYVVNYDFVLTPN